MMRRWRYILIGFLFDLPDFLGFGLIPGLGDVFDLIGVAYFYSIIGKESLLGLIEIFLAADVIPTFTLLGIYATFQDKRRKMIN